MTGRKRRGVGGLVLVLGLALVGGCEEPIRKSARPLERPTRAPEQRRAHALTTPGVVGRAGDATFYVEIQRDRPESEGRRPVLVEEDARRREVGFAYLSGPAVKGFVDLDVVIVATKTELTCYDVARHEKRWVAAFDEDKEIDDFVRRADRLDVRLEGGTTVTLDLETGRRSVP
jgi:hypothetical protein